MSAGKEALKSQCPDVIKNARDKTKVQVKNGFKKLQGLLTRKDNQFDHEQISELNVFKYQKKLKDHYDLFEDLHLKYCFIRPVFKDEAVEINEQESEFQYFDEYERKYDFLANLHAEYMNSLTKYKVEKDTVSKLD